jgi:hypothetical protein
MSQESRSSIQLRKNQRSAENRLDLSQCLGSVFWLLVTYHGTKDAVYIYLALIELQGSLDHQQPVSTRAPLFSWRTA